MSEIAPVLGVLAGVIGVADTIPYVRDTLRGSVEIGPDLTQREECFGGEK